MEKDQKPLAYVPILSMLQKLLNKTDVLNRAISENVHLLHEYRSCADGQYFNENCLLTSNEFTIALGLYTDDFKSSADSVWQAGVTLRSKRYVLVSFNSEKKTPMIGMCRK